MVGEVDLPRLVVLTIEHPVAIPGAVSFLFEEIPSVTISTTHAERFFPGMDASFQIHEYKGHPQLPYPIQVYFIHRPDLPSVGLCFHGVRIPVKVLEKGGYFLRGIVTSAYGISHSLSSFSIVLPR
jgi:hypothetical protein